MRSYILDSNGNPVYEPNYNAWSRWYGQAREAGSTQVLRTVIEDGLTVSTVFLGLDHGFSASDNGRPILWETMLFDERGMVPTLAEDNACQRYSSRELAEAGHNSLCETVRSLLDAQVDPELHKEVEPPIQLFDRPRKIRLKR